MGRRSRDESILEMLMEILEFIFRNAPPWSSIPVAVVGFCVIFFTWAAAVPKFPVLQIFGLVFATTFAALCLIAGWKGAEFRRRQQTFLRTEIDLTWVNGLSWQGFERQLAEVYRQQGYVVEETGGGGADGGIDLKLFKDGRVTVVQCKHWKTWKVNVKPIRELYGVMMAEKADAAIFITSHEYTSDALKFVGDKPMELIDQRGFLDLVRCFQKELGHHYGVEVPVTTGQPPAKPDPQNCPLCQSPMKLRTARKGKSAGSQFWGCSRFPACHGTRDYLP